MKKLHALTNNTMLLTIMKFFFRYSNRDGASFYFCSSSNEIKKILENNKNLVETEGTLELIKVEGGWRSRSFDVKIEFKNQDGKVFSYDETYTPSDSKASFLWKCENKGKVAVTVIYNKKNLSEYYIKELKELEVSENSKIGLTIIGGLFILAGLCTIIFK